MTIGKLRILTPPIPNTPALIKFGINYFFEQKSGEQIVIYDGDNEYYKMSLTRSELDEISIASPGTRPGTDIFPVVRHPPITVPGSTANTGADSNEKYIAILQNTAIIYGFYQLISSPQCVVKYNLVSGEAGSLSGDFSSYPEARE